MFKAKLQWLKSLLADFAGLIYPDVCQICETEHATASQGYVCEKCRGKIKYIEPPFCKQCGKPYEGSITMDFICGDCKSSRIYFDRARSVARYDDVIKKVVHLYKYRGALWVEPLLFKMLLEYVEKELNYNDWDAIIPVPLHFVKYNERGFNQAERLSAFLSKSTGIQLNTRLLKRVKYTETQTTLDRTKRGENVKNAFAVSDNSMWLKGKRLILIDDVMTTGATVNECAKVLRRAGAVEIAVWTVARG